MIDLFRQVIFKEAPGDEDEPTTPETPTADPPPTDATPPDIGDDEGGGDTEPTEGDTTAPPDVPDLEDMTPDGSEQNEEELKEPEVSEKVSAVMNASLYQKFLTLRNTISTQLDIIRGSNDVIFTISPDALELIDPFTKLNDNMQLYLADKFTKSNYSTNLLFYNKCLNLLNILNKIFTAKLKKKETPEDVTSI